MEKALTVPQFIEINIEKIVSETKAYYESLTGKIVQPGQPEMFLINTFAYRELLVRSGIQSAGLSMLVNFATAPTLDFLAQGVSISRLAAAPSICTLEFTLVEGHAEVTIPAGTRVQSEDGFVIFETNVEKVVIVGVNTIEIAATCTTTGISGNGYLVGEINTPLDPYPYVVSVENITATTAGYDQESDEELRDRIKIAPNSFSVAGPTNAYKFWAKSASALIVDVSAVSVTAGEMQVYPLVAGGETTPTEILDLVTSILNADNIRPLCDTVVVLAPEKITYSIVVALELYEGVIAGEVSQIVNDALLVYTNLRKNTLGLDATADQIKAICMTAGVYGLVLTGFTDVIVTKTQYAYCDSIAVTTPTTNVG
jgi:phage-related baseplate assembly protein